MYVLLLFLLFSHGCGPWVYIQYAILTMYMLMSTSKLSVSFWLHCGALLCLGSPQRHLLTSHTNWLVQAACQHAATVALHMLLEAWNLYGAGRSSEHGDAGLDDDAVSSPVQYKIPQFKKVRSDITGCLESTLLKDDEKQRWFLTVCSAVHLSVTWQQHHMVAYVVRCLVCGR